MELSLKGLMKKGLLLESIELFKNVATKYVAVVLWSHA